MKKKLLQIVDLNENKERTNRLAEAKTMRTGINYKEIFIMIIAHERIRAFKSIN